jgi:hypothetical protein
MVKSRPDKKAFLHLRLEWDLKEQIQDYARRRRTSVSALVTHYFQALLAVEEQRKNPPDAEQI